MIPQNSRWISLGIVYFLWIIFYIHLHIHKVSAVDHVVITADQESNGEKDSRSDYVSNDSNIYNNKIKSTKSQKHLNKIHWIKPRSTGDLDINRSYRPYNDWPLFQPILFTSYIQQNNRRDNAFFEAGETENLPPTEFNINPSKPERPDPPSKDVTSQLIMSTSNSPQVIGRQLEEDSTISLRDRGMPMNVRPNAFFLSDDDVIVDGNTTLMPLAVPYTNNENTKPTEIIQASISSEATMSTILPTKSLKLTSLSSQSSLVVDTEVAKNEIKPTASTIEKSLNTVFKLPSTTISFDRPLETTSESSRIKVESSWDKFGSESGINIQSVTFGVTSVMNSVMVVTTAAATNKSEMTTKNDSEVTTPYIMKIKPGDIEPDIITAPPIGSQVKTVNVSSGFGLGSKFNQKGQVLKADINSKPNNDSSVSSSKPIQSSELAPENSPKSESSSTTKLPTMEAKPLNTNNFYNKPNSFNDPLEDDYNIETKNDPILETCTLGDDTSCDAKLNEVCRKENGVSNCGCRLGSIRKKNNDICRRGRQFSTLITLDKDGNNKLNYGPDFLPSGRQFVRTKTQLEKAITTIFRGSEFGQYIIASKLNIFSPHGDSLVANTTIIFDAAPIFDLEDVMHRLKRTVSSSLSNNSNRIGKSNLYTPRNSEITLDDINECGRSELNDCDKFATCTNSIGSFSCECKSGYKDPDAGSPDNKGRKCGGSCSNDYCNGHGECHLVDVDVKSCKCHGSWSGEQCSVDGQVLGVAIGSSVVALLIIIVTLIFLIRWSRRSKAKASATRTMSSSQSCNTFTYMKGPPYHIVEPRSDSPPERPPKPKDKQEPPLIRLSQESLVGEPKWPKDPFERYKGQDIIYHNILDAKRIEDSNYYQSPRSSIVSPYKPVAAPRIGNQQNLNFPVREEDLNRYFENKGYIPDREYEH